MEIECFDEKWKNVQLSDEAKKYYIDKAKKIYDKELDNVIVKYSKGNKAEIFNVPDDAWEDFFYKENFERIRRITGYLTGATTTWNNAKQAELRDRVKHI